jgi:hypothetical protein
VEADPVGERDGREGHRCRCEEGQLAGLGERIGRGLRAYQR